MVPNGFPGEDLIDAGLDDLRRGARTEASLLVSVGAPRLRQLGNAVPNPFPDPEKTLYALLALEDQDSAHSRYNALVRKLVNLERAAACVRWPTTSESGSSWTRSAGGAPRHSDLLGGGHHSGPPRLAPDDDRHRPGDGPRG